MAALDVNLAPSDALSVDPPDTSPAEPGRRGWTRLELALAAALLIVLTSLALVSDTGYQVITDEGVVLAQSDLLLDGAWGAPFPVPDADLDLLWPPVDGSSVGDGRYFPYVKHVAYPLVVAGATWAAGTAGPLLVSAWAVWIAALAGAAIAARLDRRLRAPTMVVLALGSPLIFDVSVVIAHGIAAALMGLLTLATLRWLDTARWRWVGPAMLLAILLTLLRSEGALAAGSLGTVLVVAGVTGRLTTTVHRSKLVVSGVLIGSAAVAAYLLDAHLAAQILVDSGMRPYSTVGGDFDLVGGRISSAWASMFNPSDQTELAAVAALGAAVATVIAALLVRRSADLGPYRVACVSAAVLAVIAAGTGTGLVTGMLVAFPLLPAGLVLLRRKELSTMTARLCVWLSGVAAIAIWLPSYAIGGSSEWGGRFYHLLLPLITPVALFGLLRVGETLARRDLLFGMATLVIVTASMSVAALREQDDLRSRAEATVQLVVPAVLAAPAPIVGDTRPVVVTDRSGLGRYGWAQLDRIRLLTLRDSAEFSEAVDSLASAGIDEVSLVLGGELVIPASIETDWDVVKDEELATWRLVHLVR